MPAYSTQAYSFPVQLQKNEKVRQGGGGGGGGGGLVDYIKYTWCWGRCLVSKGRWIVLMCERVNWQRTREKSNLSLVQTSLRVKGTVLAKANGNGRVLPNLQQ